MLCACKRQKQQQPTRQHSTNVAQSVCNACDHFALALEIRFGHWKQSR